MDLIPASLSCKNLVWLGSVVVRELDLQSAGCEFDSRGALSY